MNASSELIIGKNIRLESLSGNHISGLCNSLCGEPDGWFAKMYGTHQPEVLQRAIEYRIKDNQAGGSRSFVTMDLKTNKIAGISHFMKIDEKNRQLEIGGTQVGKDFRRTYVNTETKLLLLSEAFENLNAIRVYFKVDTENVISQKSILRIGAKFEGTFRNDWILPDGRIRDGRVYSIVESEWPKIKKGLSDTLFSRGD